MKSLLNLGIKLILFSGNDIVIRSAVVTKQKHWPTMAKGGGGGERGSRLDKWGVEMCNCMKKDDDVEEL